MEKDRDDCQVREFRLEGTSLFVIGGLFLVALACAFYVGRWVERRSTGSGAATMLAERSGAESTGPETPVDVSEQAGYFDTIEGETEAEPERQAIELPSTTPEVVEGSAGLQARAQERAAPPPEQSAPAAGPFYVQLFAGRDKASAERLVRGLGDRGYRVRLDTEPAGDALLYRVRVGGYAAKPDAEVLAERLRKDGYPDAWVTRVD
jgi:cell division septation protein DedD